MIQLTEKELDQIKVALELYIQELKTNREDSESNQTSIEIANEALHKVIWER